MDTFSRLWSLGRRSINVRFGVQFLHFVFVRFALFLLLKKKVSEGTGWEGRGVATFHERSIDVTNCKKAFGNREC